MPVLGLGLFQAPVGSITETAVRTALDIGYRLFDTAAMYGNEAEVGDAIRTSGIPREEIFVTTKLWNNDQGFETALKAFERSHTALNLGPIDLYLIHWPVSEKRRDSWRALTAILKDGKSRSIGVSNFTITHLHELLQETDVVPAVNQVEFSPFLYQKGLLQFCRESRIQLEAYAPLTRGRRFSDPTLARIAQTLHKTPAQVLIRWGLQHNVIEIPKSVRRERIVENAGALSFELSSTDMTALDALNNDFRTSWNPNTIP
ncbi:MAG: aldo/keto reductase [Thermoplasmata archaeon]